MVKMFQKILLCGLISAVFFACKEEKNIDYDRLPGAAQTFIEKYFPGIEVDRVVREKDDGTKSYEVFLADGTQIDFNSDGEWLDVESTFAELPITILPEQAGVYLTENYPDAQIYGIENERGGYIVKIYDADRRPLELLFDTTGDFVREQLDY